MQKRAKSPLKPTPKAYDFSGENREQRIGNWFVNNRDFPSPNLDNWIVKSTSFVVFLGAETRVLLFHLSCSIYLQRNVKFGMKFFSTIKVDNNTRVFKR